MNTERDMVGFVCIVFFFFWCSRRRTQATG
jgi:hypothetical protein